MDALPKSVPAVDEQQPPVRRQTVGIARGGEGEREMMVQALVLGARAGEFALQPGEFGLQLAHVRHARAQHDVVGGHQPLSFATRPAASAARRSIAPQSPAASAAFGTTHVPPQHRTSGTAR